jgi:phospholipase/carboxylesterase
MIKKLALALLLFSGMANADLPIHTDLPLSYVEKAAPETAGKPLVILMHGYGSNELDLFALYTGLPADYTYLSVRAPITLAPGRFQWFRQTSNERDYNGETADLTQSTHTLSSFIDQAVNKYHPPARKVYLVGFSQGAMMSYELALRAPEKVGGIAALSGKILPVLRNELKNTQGFGNLAVFIGHGTADQRIPLAGATQADEFLRQHGLQAVMRTYPGLTHSINLQEIADLKGWLLERNAG